MLLSQTSEYALRAAIVLSRVPQGVFVESFTISEQGNIPPAYAAKILRRLVVARLVEARRGVHGGFRLARAPSGISFRDVLGAVEPVDDQPAHCAFGHPQCHSDHPCPMHDAYVALRDCFYRWSENATLADLGTDVGRLLGPSAAHP